MCELLSITVVGKRVSEPSEWSTNWIQRVGHIYHRQKYHTDGKSELSLIIT